MRITNLPTKNPRQHSSLNFRMDIYGYAIVQHASLLISKAKYLKNKTFFTLC